MIAILNYYSLLCIETEQSYTYGVESQPLFKASCGCSSSEHSELSGL